jgi:hypothetical protein
VNPCRRLTRLEEAARRWAEDPPLDPEALTALTKARLAGEHIPDAKAWLAAYYIAETEAWLAEAGVARANQRPSRWMPGAAALRIDEDEPPAPRSA